MLNGNVARHKGRKAAGNPRSPQSTAATPACDNIWLTGRKLREHEKELKEELKVCKYKNKENKDKCYCNSQNKHDKREKNADELKEQSSQCCLASVGLRSGKRGNSMPLTPWWCGQTSPTRLSKSPQRLTKVDRGET